MSDAKKQSIERCKYNHDWKAKVEKSQIVAYYCEKCGYTPRPDSAKWHEAASIIHLRGILSPGDVVYTILRNVSRSGMNRRISLVVGHGENVQDITWDAANAMGDSVKNRAGYVQDVGISVGGCGMDMGFHLVYNLSRILFADGFVCAGEKCQSNDHFNDRKPYKFERDKFKGQMHTGDGGYALRHQWL